MVKFRQKAFTEYDAMRELYVTLQRECPWMRIETCNSSALIPILRGNNIVIERFVISDYLFGKSKYRMYIKIGAKAKMPDEVRLSTQNVEKHAFGSLKIGFNPKYRLENKQYSSKYEIKQFGTHHGGGSKPKKDNKPKNDPKSNFIYTKELKFQDPTSPYGKDYIDISYEVEELLGEALEYNKKDRSLVLEFKDMRSATRALNILPFGINYKIYLLDL
jgi:hypothetical protein